MKHKKQLFILLSLMTQICSITLSQDSLNVSMIGEAHNFVEQSYDVSMSGNYAYVASGLASGLRILDLTYPASPLEIAYIVNDDNCPGVELWMADRILVEGNYAYVLYFDGTWSFANYRLYIYDISDPSIPEKKGFISLPDRCTNLFVYGEYVYVTVSDFNSFCGVKIIDISEPNQPIEIGSFQTSGYPESIIIENNIAYIAENSRVSIYDVMNPSTPVFIGEYIPAGNMPLIHQVNIQGDILYVADSEFGIRILDVSDFSNIQEIASFSHNQNNVLYSRIVVQEDHLNYLQNGDMLGNQMIILDISDPTTPFVIGTYDMIGDWWFYGFDCYSDYACVAGGSYGTRILDITDPNSVEEIADYRPNGLNYGMAALGNFAYISTYDDTNNVLIYDVTDPSWPVQVNSLTFPGRPKWISLDEDFLYVPGVEINLNPGVSVLDISNPSQPNITAHWPLPPGNIGVPLSVDRYDNLAFVSLGYGGVQIYDVSQISQAIALDNWTLWDPSTNADFAVRNTKVLWPYLYAPNEAYGLHVLDISDPYNIKEVASCQTPGMAWWVELSNDESYIYLADFTGGIRIFDISNPQMPIEVASIEDNLIMANHVVALGDSIYVLDNQGIGLHIYDMTCPTVPMEVAFHKTPGVKSTGIDLANNLIYVSDFTHFEIFQVGDSPASDNFKPLNLMSDKPIYSIYPNPSPGRIQIDFEITKDSYITIQLCSLSGINIRTLVDEAYLVGHYNISRIIEGILTGSYLIKTTINKELYLSKLIIVNR